MDQNQPRDLQLRMEESGTAHQPGAAPDPRGTVQAGAAPSQPGVAQAEGARPDAVGTAAPPRHHILRRTRTGGAWVALALSVVILLLLLIFILENGHSVSIAFFGGHASPPLGVALLLAAVAGALVVLIPGTGRIIQLRRTARRHRRLDAAAAAPQAGPQPNGRP